MARTVYILVGLPGAGKSSYAKKLSLPGTTEICSADDYFGKSYKWSAYGLEEAHDYCMTKFRLAIKNNKDNIFIDNTNIKPTDRESYKKLAKFYGYDVYEVFFGCTIEESMSRNSHNVPKETIEKMYNSLTQQGFYPRRE